MISENQRKYLEEVERLKDISVEPGTYIHKNSSRFLYEILEVDVENNSVKLKGKNGLVDTKTLHWCKKYLVKA
jgi:hypothetical protein